MHHAGPRLGTPGSRHKRCELDSCVHDTATDDHIHHPFFSVLIGRLPHDPDHLRLQNHHITRHEAGRSLHQQIVFFSEIFFGGGEGPSPPQLSLGRVVMTTREMVSNGPFNFFHLEPRVFFGFLSPGLHSERAHRGQSSLESSARRETWHVCNDSKSAGMGTGAGKRSDEHGHREITTPHPFVHTCMPVYVYEVMCTLRGDRSEIGFT
jgi:hypothetical protein